MQTLRLQAHVNSDGSVQLQMPKQLANQDIELILVYQPITNSNDSDNVVSPQEDPLIGLFSGSPNLSTQAKTTLKQDITPDAGFTWKLS